VLEKLLNEISVVGRAAEHIKLNRTDLHNMKYLQNILKESE
jgi:ribosomal protein S15P/S13E